MTRTCGSYASVSATAPYAGTSATIVSVGAVKSHGIRVSTPPRASSPSGLFSNDAKASSGMAVLVIVLGMVPDTSAWGVGVRVWGVVHSLHMHYY